MGEPNTAIDEAMFRHDAEHPADQMLRSHVLETHNVQILDIAEAISADYGLSQLLEIVKFSRASHNTYCRTFFGQALIPVNKLCL